MYEVSYSLNMIYNFKENFTPTNYIHITKGYCNFYVFKIDHKPGTSCKVGRVRPSKF